MKNTPLTDWHVGHGAVMGDFGGYSMPLWYPSGAKVEHCTVLTHAGLFDTSHQPLILVTGPDAFDFLQYIITRDLSRIGKRKIPLECGRCTNGVFLNEDGCVVDDCLIYCLGGGESHIHMIVINAGMGDLVADHIRRYAGDRDVTIEALTDIIGKIDIQGPLSAKILAKCLANPDEVFDGMIYYRFKGRFDPDDPQSEAVRRVDGVPILMSRTGYTGEFGFELYLEREHVLSTWEMLLDAGREYGLIASGFAARDSLRAGAVLPLSHQDVGDWPFMCNPWTYALPYGDDGKGFTKDFVGRSALENVSVCEYTYPFAGFDMRKVTTHGEPAAVVDSAGIRIGTVLSSVSDMAVGRVGDRIFSITSPDAPEGFSPRGLSCGFVKVTVELKIGDRVFLKDERRKVEVEIVNSVRPDRTARNPIRDML